MIKITCFLSAGDALVIYKNKCLIAIGYFTVWVCLTLSVSPPPLIKPFSVPLYSQVVWCICLISLAFISSHYSTVQDFSPTGCSRPPQRAIRWEQITLGRVMKSHGVGVESFLFPVFFFFLCLRLYCVSRLLLSGIVTTRMSGQRNRTVLHQFCQIMIR